MMDQKTAVIQLDLFTSQTGAMTGKVNTPPPAKSLLPDNTDMTATAAKPDSFASQLSDAEWEALNDKSGCHYGHW